MRKVLFASVALGVLASGSAMAQVTGTASGGYAGVVSNGNGSVWNFNGTAMDHISDAWGVEGTGTYQHATPGSIDSFTLGGSLFTQMDIGRVAATVAYSGLGPIHAVQYGIGGDWYLSEDFTLSAKGGGASLTGAGFSSDGGYFGGQATWYAMPNLALSGGADYMTASGLHITTETAKAEWLFSDTIPLSIYGGYQHSESFGASTDVLFAGLKFYLDGGSSLVSHQRTGSLGYISQGVTF